MSTSSKLKALLNIKGAKIQDLAECLEMNVQSVRTKFYRNSFSGDDLIKIASFLDCDLAFIVDDSQKISLDKTDLKTGGQ